MTLLELRNKCKLTQKEASDLAHTSLRTYCTYEKDEDVADQLKLQRIKQLLEEYADNSTDILKDSLQVNFLKSESSLETKRNKMILDMNYKSNIQNTLVK